MKLKAMIHNVIFVRMYQLFRSFSNATRSVILDLVHEYQLISCKEFHFLARKNKYRNNVLLDSFRLHYNWCSSAPPSLSRVLPMPSPVAHGKAEDMKHQYESTTWNPSFSASSADKDDDVSLCDWDVAEKQEAEELSSYLQWLEEKGNGNPEDANEIDRLADLFIASCHEKFRLEKIESYRKYQEMLARGI